MQLVLSNNRVLAHGENFISMGSTVINTVTNKVYQNATVAECDNCPSDIGKVGYEYHAGVFVPCAPYGKGNGNIMVACQEDCGTPKDSGCSAYDVYAMPSYLTFVGNVNESQVSAAFGKNNEDRVHGVGTALAMYAKYGNSTINIAAVFPELIKCDTLADILKSNLAQAELLQIENVREFVYANAYANSVVFNTLLTNDDTVTTCTEDEPAVVKTYKLNITNDILTKLFYLQATYQGRRYASYNPKDCYIKINGVEVFRFADTLDSNRGVFREDQCVYLSELGITEPGEYDIEIQSASSGTSVYDDCTTSLKVVTTK